MGSALFWEREGHDLVPAQPPAYCATLGKSLYLSGPPFLHLKMKGLNDGPSENYPHLLLPLAPVLCLSALQRLGAEPV